MSTTEIMMFHNLGIKMIQTLTNSLSQIKWLWGIGPKMTPQYIAPMPIMFKVASTKENLLLILIFRMKDRPSPSTSMKTKLQREKTKDHLKKDQTSINNNNKSHKITIQLLIIILEMITSPSLPK
jgi:hypothetical protein